MQTKITVIGAFRFPPERMTYILPHLKATIEKFGFERSLQQRLVVPPQATYLAGVNCSALKRLSARIAEILLDKESAESTKLLSTVRVAKASLGSTLPAPGTSWSLGACQNEARFRLRNSCE